MNKTLSLHLGELQATLQPFTVQKSIFGYGQLISSSETLLCLSRAANLGQVTHPVDFVLAVL